MHLIYKVANWTPKTRFYYGWIAIAVGALGTYAATGGAQVTLAGIQTLIFDDTGWSQSTVALGVTIGTWTAGLLTPIFGKIADRSGPRIVMAFAAITTGACFIWIGGMSTIWHFYVAYIIARGLGNPALIGVVPRTVAVNFFRRRRNLALGLVSMARPCFGAINVQLVTFIAMWSSWRHAYRMLGVYSIILSIPLLILMRRRPEDIGLLPDGDSQKESTSSPTKKIGGVKEKHHVTECSWNANQAVRSTTLWVIISAEFLIILTSGTIGFQLVPYLTDSGMSIRSAAAAWSLSSLLNAFANPFWGILADKYSPRTLILSAIPLCLFVTSLFLLVSGGAATFTCVAIWGATSGGLNVLGGMIIANYYGREHFGTISGIMGPFQTCGLGLGPILGALILNVEGGYRTLFFFAIAAYITAIGLFILARKPKRRICRC